MNPDIQPQTIVWEVACVSTRKRLSFRTQENLKTSIVTVDWYFCGLTRSAHLWFCQTPLFSLLDRVETSQAWQDKWINCQLGSVSKWSTTSCLARAIPKLLSGKKRRRANLHSHKNGNKSTLCSKQGPCVSEWPKSDRGPRRLYTCHLLNRRIWRSSGWPCGTDGAPRP